MFQITIWTQKHFAYAHIYNIRYGMLCYVLGAMLGGHDLSFSPATITWYRGAGHNLSGRLSNIYMVNV